MSPRRVLEGVGEILAQDGNSNEVLVFSSGPKIKSDKFMDDQKNAEKRLATVLIQRQKNKEAQKLGYVSAPVLSHKFKKCVTCGRQHPDKECWRCNGKFFSYSKVGHKAVDYKKPRARTVVGRIIYQG